LKLTAIRQISLQQQNQEQLGVACRKQGQDGNAYKGLVKKHE
jgi:hypothetical protein